MGEKVDKGEDPVDNIVNEGEVKEVLFSIDTDLDSFGGGAAEGGNHSIVVVVDTPKNVGEADDSGDQG